MGISSVLVDNEQKGDRIFIIMTFQDKWRTGMRSKGFTLIELMITVAIVGILATVAYPSYRDSIMRAHRSDAHTALMEIKLRENKLRANCRYYGSISGAYACNAVNTSTIAYTNNSPEGYYTLVVNPTSALAYTATATAVGGQADDTDCATITLTVSAANPEGVKGGTSGADCW